MTAVDVANQLPVPVW